jgi:hypothetical protein
VRHFAKEVPVTAYAEGAMRSSKLFSSIFFYIDPGIIRPIHHPIE